MSFSQGCDKRFCDICVGFYDFCIRKRKKLRHLCPFLRLLYLQKKKNYDIYVRFLRLLYLSQKNFYDFSKSATLRRVKSYNKKHA